MWRGVVMTRLDEIFAGLCTYDERIPLPALSAWLRDVQVDWEDEIQ